MGAAMQCHSRRAIGAPIRYRFYWSIEKPDLTKSLTKCRLMRDVINNVSCAAHVNSHDINGLLNRHSLIAHNLAIGKCFIS
jgi:hypothetical protein